MAATDTGEEPDAAELTLNNHFYGLDRGKTRACDWALVRKNTGCAEQCMQCMGTCAEKPDAENTGKCKNPTQLIYTGEQEIRRREYRRTRRRI